MYQTIANTILHLSDNAFIATELWFIVVACWLFAACLWYVVRKMIKNW